MNEIEPYFPKSGDYLKQTANMFSFRKNLNAQNTVF